MEIDITTGAAVLTVVSNTYGEFRVLVDTDKWEQISQHSWAAEKSDNGRFYFRTNVIDSTGKATTRLLHRLVTSAPKGSVVDHKRGWLDNRVDSLFVGSSIENNRHMRKRCDNTSGYIGVTWCKARKKWNAYARIKGKHKRVGRFDCPVQAAKARDLVVREHYGEHAVLNFSQ